MSKELYKYYSLNECMDTEKVFKHLEPLNESGKIYFEESDETLMLEDIELSDNEIKKIINLFESNDVLRDIDREEIENEDDDEYPDFHGDYEI